MLLIKMIFSIIPSTSFFDYFVSRFLVRELNLVPLYVSLRLYQVRAIEKISSSTC